MRESLLKDVVAPHRFGKASEFALLVRQLAPFLLQITITYHTHTVSHKQAQSIIDNPYLNALTIRIDAGIRMSNL